MRVLSDTAFVENIDFAFSFAVCQKKLTLHFTERLFAHLGSVNGKDYHAEQRIAYIVGGGCFRGNWFFHVLYCSAKCHNFSLLRWLKRMGKCKRKIETMAVKIRDCFTITKNHAILY